MPSDTCACGRPVRCKGLCKSCYSKALYRAAKPLEPRPCQRCGEPFTPRSGRHIICTETCQHRGEAERQAARNRARRSKGRVWSCLQCGQDISHMRSDAKFCTDPCANRWDLENNRARIMATTRAWRAADPDRTRDMDRLTLQNRRQKLRGNPGSVGVASKDWQRLVRRHGGRCAYCGERSAALHVEHVVPVSRGGRHAIGNILPACPTCNWSKNQSLLIVWRLRRRRFGNPLRGLGD